VPAAAGGGGEPALGVGAGALDRQNPAVKKNPAADKWGIPASSILCKTELVLSH